MIRIGCHLSPSKGLVKMGRDALSIGANTFQFFLRNPRGGKAKTLDHDDAAVLMDLLRERDMLPIVAHAPYTLNPCAADPRVQEFAAMVMKDDLERMKAFPGNLYNFHPGSHVGQGTQKGIEKTAALLNALLSQDMPVTVLIETMAGQGSEIGGTFEQVAEIIRRMELQDKVGVCLDTCHVFAAGYDIVHDLDGVLEAFDKYIGLCRLKALHINDSMMPLGSHRDRHAPIGKGCIGFSALLALVNHPALTHLPMILETPQDELAGYAREIRLLRGKAVDNL
jgi:deoxyribonuclease-4